LRQQLEITNAFSEEKYQNYQNIDNSGENKSIVSCNNYNIDISELHLDNNNNEQKKNSLKPQKETNFELDKFDEKLNFLVNEVSKFNPREREGFIICDGNFNRLKVKSPNYVKYQWMFHANSNKTVLKNKTILRMIVLNEYEECLEY
jgi:hypothetical protein